MLIEFNAQKRTLQGTGASRRLRRAGRVPGVIYGGEQPAEAIEFDHNEVFHKLKQETFHASVLTMLIDGGRQNVLLRDVPCPARLMRISGARDIERRTYDASGPGRMNLST